VLCRTKQSSFERLNYCEERSDAPTNTLKAFCADFLGSVLDRFFSLEPHLKQGGFGLRLR